jgi:hypothetical protein
MFYTNDTDCTDRSRVVEVPIQVADRSATCFDMSKLEMSIQVAAVNVCV